MPNQMSHGQGALINAGLAVGHPKYPRECTLPSCRFHQVGGSGGTVGRCVHLRRSRARRTCSSQLRVLIFVELNLRNIVQCRNLVERQHIGELHTSREPCAKDSDLIERGLCQRLRGIFIRCIPHCPKNSMYSSTAHGNQPQW
jgi:hypothetical protein